MKRMLSAAPLVSARLAPGLLVPEVPSLPQASTIEAIMVVEGQLGAATRSVTGAKGGVPLISTAGLLL